MSQARNLRSFWPSACLVVASMLLGASPLAAEVRRSSFSSAALGRTDVGYVVDLPPSYDQSEARYPVVYALHGLFEGAGFWERRGLATALDHLRETKEVGELVVVAVDGESSFFLNGPMGRYEDLVTHDLIAHVEATYRVVTGRSGRALLGISMGGYAALRIGFSHPDLFAAVATHSAMLLERIPSAAQGARRGHMRAFHQAFGDPIDEELWTRSDPLVLASRVAPEGAPALYIDCGAQDRYGLARGHRAVHQTLDERGVAHDFALPPGDHGYEFVRARLATSLPFLWKALN